MKKLKWIWTAAKYGSTVMEIGTVSYLLLTKVKKLKNINHGKV